MGAAAVWWMAKTAWAKQRRNTAEEEGEAGERRRRAAKIESVEGWGKLITTTQANKSKPGLITNARHRCLLICQSLPLFFGRSCGSRSRYRSISRRQESWVGAERAENNQKLNKCNRKFFVFVFFFIFVTDALEEKFWFQRPQEGCGKLWGWIASR